MASSPFERHYLTIASHSTHSFTVHIHANTIHAHLEPEVELLERAPHLRDERVHAFALLEADQDVRGAFSRLRGDVGHVVLLW